MKRHLFGLVTILFLASTVAEAQTEEVFNSELFVFPDFSVSVVRMKNKEKINLALNYNIVTGKMIFFQKNQYFDMLKTEQVDTVYIHERKFVPYEKVFHEVLIKGPVALFMEHRGDLRQPPKPAGYGGTSEVSASTYINNLQMGGQVYRRSTEAPLLVDSDPAFWIRKDNNMYPVLNRKALLKIFSDKEAEIENFIRRRKADIRNPEHLRSVVEHYIGLTQERMP